MEFGKYFAFVAFALMLALPSMAYAIPTTVSDCPGYTILGVGQNMSIGAFTLRLSDIPTAGSNGNYPAIFDILYNGGAIGQFQVIPNSTYDFGSNGNSLHIAVSVC